LDFVLAHPDLDYLETEHEKVRYFHDQLSLPFSLLPHRTYKGTQSHSETDRYFVDRFSIFLGGPESGSHQPFPTFVYCDSAAGSLLGFVSYLENYQILLRRLPSFDVIYAAPNARKFHRAEGCFTRLFTPTARIDAHRLHRYFTIRHLWESGHTSQLTRVDRDLLRDGDQRYQGPLFAQAYREFVAKGLSPTEVDNSREPRFGATENALQDPSSARAVRHFGPRFHQEKSAPEWNHAAKCSFHQRFRSEFHSVHHLSS